ncbi:MAG TPA: response regulator [Opitutales bacterium]|nr:response regulator [Opitutales bacterium]
MYIKDKTLTFEAAPKWTTAGQLAMEAGSSAAAKGRARILIADDNMFMRYSVSYLISLGTGLEVVGEAVNGQDAVTQARALRPDIVIMDVNMPLMDGVEATFLITEERPETLVVGFSASDGQNIKDKMLKAGAVDLIDKGEAVSILLPSLHRLWAERGR